MSASATSSRRRRRSPPRRWSSSVRTRGSTTGAVSTSISPTGAWKCDPSRREIVSSRGRASVLVVDDSAFMRRVIGEIIDGSPDFHVVGTARNGHEAIRQIHALEPDIVTLDVEMPELDGLQTLGYIMSEAPRAVVMLSAAGTQGGVHLTLRSLERGAA